MSSVVQLGSAQLLPIKAASELVPYSRDYVARLARESKIVAVYIDRQWFVDTTSLQNFYTNSLMEESVRKRHLSAVRKHDLEVKEIYRSSLASLAKKRTQTKSKAIVQSGLIIMCGLVAGLALFTSNNYLTNERLQFLAQIPGNGWLSPVSEIVPDVAGDIQTVFTEYRVTETDAPLSLQNGIILLPASATDTVSTVDNLFSDPVSVEVTSTTTGIVRTMTETASSTEMQFVRIPQEVKVVSLASTSRNTVTP